MILSGSEDGTIREWDIDTGQCIRVLERFHEDKVSFICSQGGGCRHHHIVSASYGGSKVYEWAGSRDGRPKRAIDAISPIYSL